MSTSNLSPLANAARQLVLHMAQGADPAYVEAACNELLTTNINGFGSADIQIAEVAVEMMRGALMGVVELRAPSISAAARGVSRSGPVGQAGDAHRLKISERACREVRDSDHASASDYTSALKGAAPALHMTADQLRARVDRTPRPSTPPTPPSTPPPATDPDAAERAGRRDTNDTDPSRAMGSRSRRPDHLPDRRRARRHNQGAFS